MDQLFETSDRPATTGRYAHVALEQSLDVSSTGLTYAIPKTLADLSVGQRVTVPLGRGNKAVPGYVVRVLDSAENTGIPVEKLHGVKAILSRDARNLSLPADLVELGRWISAYYCCPLGMVFLAMLPAAVKHGTGTIARTMVSLASVVKSSNSPSVTAANESSSVTAAGVPPAEVASSTKLTKLQKQVLEVLREKAAAGELAETQIEIKRLADLAGAKSIAPVKQLIERGLLVSGQQDHVRAKWDESDGSLDAPAPRSSTRLELTPDQASAVTHLTAHLHQGFSVHLLHGVTGSGKTEVYLRVIESLLNADESAVSSSHSSIINHQSSITGKETTGVLSGAGVIMLVPEISLTPQTAHRFTSRFGPMVAVLHSGLSAAQRHEQWQRIRRGGARIVVGARSAIFAPLPRIGLIIVDEEHENSYKQDQLPRYHGRDVAIRRAQMLGIPVILGSATPSLESYHRATGESAPYRLIRLPNRVAGFKLPRVELVDMQAERRNRSGVHLMSLRLEELLRECVYGGAGLGKSGGGQAILLLNRRGYANYIACPDPRCGWMMRCEFCDATMVYHKDGALPAGGLVRCHHCDAQQLLPERCPNSPHRLTIFGLGTQRVEEEIGRKFPKLRFLRMDGDTMRSSRDYHASLQAFGRGEIDLLIGTQMIAKGLDFPNVRMVGVISGDTALHLPDFRAAERTFQLIAQVAGRAGRGEKPGVVVVQTFNPEDPSIVLASRHDYESFAAREMKLRQDVNLPPVTRMARVVCRDLDHVKCVTAAKELAEHVNEANRTLGGVVRVRGPMPCPIARIGGFHRQQVELLAPDAATLQKLLTMVRNARKLRSDGHMAVDVDPVSLM